MTQKFLDLSYCIKVRVSCPDIFLLFERNSAHLQVTLFQIFFKIKNQPTLLSVFTHAIPLNGTRFLDRAVKKYF
jgi:hypothetical protein